MKHFSFALMLSAAFLSGGCAKDWSAYQRQQAIVHRHFQNYELVQEQMFRFHEQARAQMLQALSPAHQQLLAKVIGRLAIAPSPQVAAAAKQIDAVLRQKKNKPSLAFRAG